MKQLRILLCRERADSAISEPTRSVWSRVDATAVLALASALPFLLAATCGAHEEEMSPAEQEISPSACLHLQERLHDKSSLTPAQRKISSDLLLNVWAERCKSAGHEVPELRTGVEVDEEGITVVDIKGDVTEQLLSRIEELPGTVVSSFPKDQTVRARIPIKRLEKLAESPDVSSIRSADQYQLHETNLSEDEEGQAS